MQANKWRRCTWHVYAFHALMEWTQSRIKQQITTDPAIVIVKKIFDFGLSQAHVQSQSDYVSQLASWLVSAAPAADSALHTPAMRAGSHASEARAETRQLTFLRAVL